MRCGYPNFVARLNTIRWAVDDTVRGTEAAGNLKLRTQVAHDFHGSNGYSIARTHHGDGSAFLVVLRHAVKLSVRSEANFARFGLRPRDLNISGSLTRRSRPTNRPPQFSTYYIYRIQVLNLDCTPSDESPASFRALETSCTARR